MAPLSFSDHPRRRRPLTAERQPHGVFRTAQVQGDGGVGAPADLTVDVCDMLCAQALAVVAQAINQLKPAGSLDVVYNAGDVKRDLSIWAKDQGYVIVEHRVSCLRIQR